MGVNKIDIKSIIKLVYAQYPSQKRMDIVKALKACNEGWWVSDHYISYHHPLKHGDYKWKERISLKDGKGTIFIDVLRDASIGGIEFKSKQS